MDYLFIILLGLVQGATEFLPVSSTAHLIFLPRILGFPDPGLVFDISLHLGTLLAVLIYFWKDWMELLVAGAEVARQKFSAESNRPLKEKKYFTEELARVPGKIWRAPRAFLAFLIIATIPGLLFGLLLENWAETLFRTPILVGLMLAVFGIILWLVDHYANHSNDTNHCTKRGAFFIGLWQALAIIPGVSRSGASITGGLLIGLKREEAVKFSFMLSAPIILASSLLGFYKFFLTGSAISIFGVILGIFTSFISGIAAIHFLIKFTQKSSFTPFVIYRIILAFLLIFLL
jgi:undecaprenyl-diphosphatase